MDRKVISLHKNLQGPRSPNADLVHNHAKLQKVIKKKTTSQASLKEKTQKPRNGSKARKGQASPSNKKNKSKSKSKSLKKSNSNSDTSSHKQRKMKNLYTGQQKSKSNFLETVTQKSFNNLQTLKLSLLSYIFKNRLVRDQQYNELFQYLVERFPDKEEVVKTMLFQIVSTLDS